MTLIEAARRLINASYRRFPDCNMSPNALTTLESDRVIIRDSGQNVYRFSHDLYGDWSLLRLLEQKRPELPNYLQGLGQPHGILRAVRLLGCMLLEGNKIDEWTSLMKAFERVSELSPRWQQAVLTAPFLSTRLKDLLDKSRKNLLDNNSRLLIKLLVALRTTEVDVDPQIATLTDSPEEALTLALNFPLPRWYVWYWTLRWLLENHQELNEATRYEASRLMEVWQERTSGPDELLRREIGELVFAWLQEIEEDSQKLIEEGIQEESDYTAREEHETRLRKIFLYSADVLPERVKEYIEYIKTAGEGERWRDRCDERGQILETFKPLVDHLPTLYVDFMLNELIVKPEESNKDSAQSMSEQGIRGAMDDKSPALSPEQNDLRAILISNHIYDMSNLGIIDRHTNYDPPAHVQGRFLWLLRSNEDEGLRLVHGLTNTATDYWRRREKNEPGYLQNSRRTPLPVVLYLRPNNCKELWGNEDVYRWYRHTSIGPPPVISALMALEVWMKEQIDSGREGGALIDKVMEDTESVAILGVCVSVALGTQGHCLPNLLPYVAHPLVWWMDINRWLEDLKRGRYILNLIQHVVINDDSARDVLDQAFATFLNDPPFQYEEERGREEVAQARKMDIESYREFLKRENHQEYQMGSKTVWRYQPTCSPSPNEHTRLDNALSPMDLQNWAWATLESSEDPDPENLKFVVQMAVSYTPPDYFPEKSSPFPTEESIQPSATHRASIDSLEGAINTNADPNVERAIVAVASTIAVKAWSWAKANKHDEWCRSVLLDAARSSRSRSNAMNRQNVSDLVTIKTCRAMGLSALVAQGVSDMEVRMAVIDLMLSPKPLMLEALFKGLRSSWSSESVLCWNCLWLAISFAIVPDGMVDGIPGINLKFDESHKARLEKLRQMSTECLKRDERPELPIDEVDNHGIYFWDLVILVLNWLPIKELIGESESKRKILDLTDSLMRWTLREDHKRTEGEALWKWNYWFLDWVVVLARNLTPAEVEQHVIAQVLSPNTPLLPRLVAYHLDRFLRYHFAQLKPDERPDPQAILTWKRMCEDLLSRPELDGFADQKYLLCSYGDLSKTVRVMVYVSSLGHYILNEEWSHVSIFVDLIDRWLKVFGTNHDAYSDFLLMLTSSVRHYQPAKVVEWLDGVTSRSKDVTALWDSNNNGKRTAKILHLVWQASRQELTEDRAILGKFSKLVDRLVANGVILASQIQLELERFKAE